MCYEILEEGAISCTSDHLPIIMTVNIDSNPHVILEQSYKLPAWHKISDEQIGCYQNFLSEPLDILSEKVNNSEINLDLAYDQFLTVIHDASG